MNNSESVFTGFKQAIADVYSAQTQSGTNKRDQRVLEQAWLNYRASLAQFTDSIGVQVAAQSCLYEIHDLQASFLKYREGNHSYRCAIAGIERQLRDPKASYKVPRLRRYASPVAAGLADAVISLATIAQQLPEASEWFEFDEWWEHTLGSLVEARFELKCHGEESASRIRARRRRRRARIEKRTMEYVEIERETLLRFAISATSAVKVPKV